MQEVATANGWHDMGRVVVDGLMQHTPTLADSHPCSSVNRRDAVVGLPRAAGFRLRLA